MKTLKDTLKPEIERWDDPGDYPSGAGSGPLPSYDYVSEFSGVVVVQLEPDELADLCSDLETDPVNTPENAKRFRNAVEDYIADNAGQVEHDAACRVTKWEVQEIDSERGTVTLAVEKFEDASLPDPPEPDYDPDPAEDYEREERHKRGAF